jgi:hypothetical protein
MSLSVYYEDSRVCDARSIGEMAVKPCSKALFACSRRHGKSPCFLRCSFLTAVGVDERVLVFDVVDGACFLD